MGGKITLRRVHHFSIDSTAMFGGRADETLFNAIIFSDAFTISFCRSIVTTHNGNISSKFPYSVSGCRFPQQEYSAEIYENEPAGKYVTHVQARSMSSLLFELVDGGRDAFSINPSSGVIATTRQLDYEQRRFYNITVQATNMWLECSPPTKASRVRFPARSYPDFRTRESCRTMPLVGRFSWASPISRRPCIPMLLDNHLASPSSDLKTFLLRAVQISPLRSSAGVGRRCAVSVHVLDRNDNAPRFPKTTYNVEVSESLPPGSLLLLDGRTPLVVAADDADSGPNGVVVHSIVEGRAAKMFHVHPRTGECSTCTRAQVSELARPRGLSTLLKRAAMPRCSTCTRAQVSELARPRGKARALTWPLHAQEAASTAIQKSSALVSLQKSAVRTAGTLDREAAPQLVFHVTAEDRGRPRLRSQHPAEVQVTLLDHDDCAPVFVRPRYRGVVALPAHPGVYVVKVSAVDRDTSGREPRYDVVDGDPGGAFALDPASGLLTVARPAAVAPRRHSLHVRASDGRLSTIAQVDVFSVASDDPSFRYDSSLLRTPFTVIACSRTDQTLPTRGPTVAERLARSPPTKANRVQSPAGSPDFRRWESCRTIPLVGGFSRGFPISPAR
ncbi:hypothetical protein PR048_004085 [Dryococelus australis]|uniref:Cadherin domain-containing protein n=1 Tax=Dryococelus australis TaxID=614101 RepID=A0ABQ9I4H5_9NEOP|nr:hypothetical protein PR048_004085 [Dryococelus australis]